ncbi:hypothetical protein PQX77_013542 [Marasmius sp. AFHP31]|nr:hypothetical protein PQX77_013542 [Marasmius sp. AFHP31]
MSYNYNTFFVYDYANSHKVLWRSTAGVGASREGKFDRGPYPLGTRVEVLEMLRDWSPSKQQKHPIHSHSVSGAAELGEWSNLDDPITAPSATRDDFQSRYSTRDDPSYREPSRPQTPGSPAKESQTKQNQYGDNFDQSTVARTSRDITNVEGSIVENSYNIENQLDAGSFKEVFFKLNGRCLNLYDADEEYKVTCRGAMLQRLESHTHEQAVGMRHQV